MAVQTKDYEQLGESAAKVLSAERVELLSSQRKMLAHSFLRGVAGGLGGVLGATVGVAALLLLLKQFHGFPLIGHYVDDIQNSIQNYRK